MTSSGTTKPCPKKKDSFPEVAAVEVLIKKLIIARIRKQAAVGLVNGWLSTGCWEESKYGNT
eukprot:1956269-Amphidinium_carterae.1